MISSTGAHIIQPLLRQQTAQTVWKRSLANSPRSAPTSETSLVRNPLQWYAAKLETHPLTTKCISSGLIAGSGDLLCQYLNASKHHGNNAKDTDGTNHGTNSIINSDWLRSLRFTALGAFLIAPTVHFWYGFLMTRIPGSGVKSVVQRLFLDQGVFAPIFLPTFVTCLTILEHTSAPSEMRSEDEGLDSHNNGDLYHHIRTRLRNDVPDALVVGWSIWIPSMGFMFAFVPSKFQVLFSNGVGFVWNAYLSWRTHEGEEEYDED